MSHRKVFVYGTLRPCSGRWGEAAEVAPPVQGTTKGALYDAGGFPYADFDGDGTIVGDVLTLDDDHSMFAEIRRIELGAGYVEREVIVETATEHLVCLTYDASPQTKARRIPLLDRVPDDDWYNVERRRYGRLARN